MDRVDRRDIHGIHFIKTHGDGPERARQHARLLREEIRRGALATLEKKNETLIRQGPGIVQLKPVQDLVVWFYRKVLIPWLDRQTKPEMHAVIQGLHEETGIPRETFRQALFQADGLMVLSRISIMKYLMSHLPAGGLVGCTSAVAFDDWTESGRMLVSRNMDYPIIGPWEKGTTVNYHEPTEKGMIPHVGVTTAGVFTAGLTAMNREGLTLAAHAHFARKLSLSGFPVLTIGNEVIRRAKTIGEAVDIVRRMNRTANWAFVIGSAKERDAVVIEMGPKEFAVRHAEDGLLTHSNYFHNPDLHRNEALISGACADDLRGRVCRVKQILEPLKGKVTAETLTGMLGDHIDYQTGDERVFGNTISVVTTVKSVVWEPETQRMLIGARGRSPMGLDHFVEVDLDHLWENGASEKDVRLVPGYRPRNPGLVEGVDAYRDAYVAYHMNGLEPDHLEKTLAALRRALAAYPDDGNLWVQTGIVAFRMKRFEEARKYFDEARNRTLVDHVRYVALLFMARSCDVLGAREEAKKIYSIYKEVEEPKLRAALRKGLRRRYRARWAEHMLLDLQYPDAHQY